MLISRRNLHLSTTSRSVIRFFVKLTTVVQEVLSLHLAYCRILLQYYADANEAESWMREKMPLVSSQDYGRDESSAKVISDALCTISSKVIL